MARSSTISAEDGVLSGLYKCTLQIWCSCRLERWLRALLRRLQMQNRSLNFMALRKNSTGPPFHAAFSKATNSIFVAARRWAFSSR